MAKFNVGKRDCVQEPTEMAGTALKNSSLGDATDPLSSFMIPPFKETFQLQHSLKKIHKDTIRLVKLWKMALVSAEKKFGVLEGLHHMDVKLCCAVVTTCLLLHNFITLNGEPIDENNLPAMEDFEIRHVNGEAESDKAKRQNSKLMEHFMH